MITVICCYNNITMLNEMLIKSLSKQSVEYTLAAIDSRKYKFKSAAQAYNDVLINPIKYNITISDYLIFAHQDIYFIDSDILSKIESLLKIHPNDILGFAGMMSNGKVISNLKYQSNNSFITRNQLSSITEVMSIDECCFAMSRQLYDKVGFDENVCHHWHLYAVDFCYNARMRFDSKTYVIPDVIYHKVNSDQGLGTDNHFLRSLLRMTIKYRHTYDKIYAPCYIISTNWFLSRLRLFRSLLGNLIKNV